MVAIETKYLGPTNHKPSRIVATTANGQRLVISKAQIDDDDTYIVHLRAAQMLRDQSGWVGRLVGGSTKRGYVFVFTEDGTTRRRTGERVSE